MLNFGLVLSTYASDCAYLLRTRRNDRSALWGALTRLLLGFWPHALLGYRVQYLSRRTLFLCFHEIFVRQIYHFETRNPRPLVIDAGANIGIATLYFKSLYPQARVWAFEPDSRNFAALRNNVISNHLEEVQLFNAALWDEDGNVDLFESPSDLGSLMTSTHPGRATGPKNSVPGMRLPPLLGEPVDLLKLDIEGAEPRVLRDLADSGKLPLVREMVIEYHHHVGDEPSRLSGFLGMLESAGYCYQISASHFPPMAHDRPQDILIRAYRRGS
jgi:FkbM family methyltransferase